MKTLAASLAAAARYGHHAYVERVRSPYRNKRFRVMLKEVTGPGHGDYRIRELGVGSSYEEALENARSSPLANEVEEVMAKYAAALVQKHNKEHENAVSQQGDSNRPSGSGPGESGSGRENCDQLPPGDVGVVGG